MLRQKPAYNCNQSYMRWTSAIHMAIDPLIKLWPSPRLFSPAILAITLSKNTYWYQSRPILHLSEAVRPLTKRLEERRKDIDVWINSETRVKMILALPLSAMLIPKLRKAFSRSRALIITKKSTTQKIALKQEKIYQKTSILFNDFYPND